jgi:phage replication-related protein YjqB (UPF0714/DUF867 family)
MTNCYKSFIELSGRETEGRDYRIRSCLRNSPVLVVAPHGGKIEPGTAEIAGAIAGEEFSFYSLEGIKSEGNGVLHIASHLFDEPRALEAVKDAEIVLTVHGQAGKIDEFVMLGGLNTDLKAEIEHELNLSGFRTLEPTEGLRATDVRNICNHGCSGKGVQLEISRGLRDSLRTDKNRLCEFAFAVRRGVKLHQRKLESRGPEASLRQITTFPGKLP